MLALFAAVLAQPLHAAHAEAKQETTGHEERRLVSVQIAGDPSSVAAVRDVLRSLNADLETTFEVVPSVDHQSVLTPGEPNAGQLARIWIDLSEPPGQEHAPVTIYVVDGPWERVLVRPVVRQANAEITWEEIGHIVELAVDALRSGESIGVAREQLLPPPPPPPAPADPEPVVVAPPPPASPRSWKLRGGGFYAVTAYGGALEVASGPGAMLELHTRKRKLEYGGALSAQYSFPSTVDRGAASVHFDSGALHLLASGSYLFSEHQLSLGLGGGIELVRAYSSSIALDNVRFAGAELHTFPTGRALARYSFSTPDVRLFAGLGVDVPLRRARYLLTRADESVVLFEPWILHPFVMFGVETN